MSNKYLFPAVLVAALIGLGLALSVGETPWLADVAELTKTLFISALRMIVAPLIFFSLIAGILRLGDANQLGRIGSVTIGYYLLTTSIAILLGLVAVFFIHPWTNMPPLSLDMDPSSVSFIADTDATIWFLLAGVVKQVLVNPFTALAELNILAIVVNALIIGVALLFVVQKDDTIIHTLDTITAALFKLTSWVIWVVPIGVVGIVYQVTITADLTLIKQLGAFSAFGCWRDDVSRTSGSAVDCTGSRERRSAYFFQTCGTPSSGCIYHFVECCDATGDVKSRSRPKSQTLNIQFCNSIRGNRKHGRPAHCSKA